MMKLIAHLMQIMKIEPLKLSHGPILIPRLSSLQTQLSEYSFANLYLFRHTHDYQIIDFQEEIYIKGITRDKKQFIMPTSPPSQISKQSFQEILKFGEIIYPIPTHWLQDFERLLGTQTALMFKEEDSDYLYLTSKLIAYPGRHLSKKRNLVKQLFKAHTVTMKSLDISLDDAQEILEKWQIDSLFPETETDFFACKEGLQHFKELPLNGQVLYIDERPQGFIMGEQLTPECYLVHFSKATRAIKGVYQHLLQTLSTLVAPTCIWTNLEQDLGLDDLRKAKHSYQPDQLLPKWRIKLGSFLEHAS